MVTKKAFQKEHLSIILMTVLLIISVVINISTAYFTDSASASNSTSLVFGTIAVKAYPNGETYRDDNTYQISADEVALGATLYKLIKIENQPATQTQDFYMRVKLSAYNNSALTNLITFSIAPSGDVTNANYGANYSSAATFNASNWTSGNGDGKLYYNTSISLPTGTVKYIPVEIGFNSSFGTENFEGAYVLFEIEIIQSANNGYTGWSSNMPSSGWPVSN